MNFRMIKNILGWILIFEAGFMLIPIVTALIYGETKSLVAFLITVAVCLGVGLLFVWRKPKKTTLYSREGFVIVSLSWIFLSLFGAIPFFLSGEIPSYIDAVFETVSGFTTTGSSILTDVEAMSHSCLIWRSFTNWVGGMGVLVFVMAFVPLSGGGNMHIMKAESPGPSVSKLVPKIRTTAAILYLIYLVLTVLQIILLLCGGMPLFDSLCASFSTAGTGGFGIKSDSMNSYSAYSQIVTTVFMLLFSINFASYYLIMLRRFKEAFSSEVRTFLIIVASAIAIIMINSWAEFSNFGDALLHTSFSVASIISTSGFATLDFNLWPELSRFVLLMLMFVGACAGSTGGGIKVSRFITMAKSVGKEIKLMIHPHQIKHVVVDKRPVESEIVRSTNVYMICYLIIFVASVGIISIGNYDFMTSVSSVAATLNNIGPGLSLVGPAGNFAFFSPLEKIVLSFDMLAGRLELFPMLLLFSPTTWKK